MVARGSARLARRRARRARSLRWAVRMPLVTLAPMAVMALVLALAPRRLAPPGRPRRRARRLR
jgi:hypothetical protein